MKRLILFFTFFTICLNAQIVNLRILDLSDNLPLDDADVYFKNSTKNFVSDMQGKAIVDLSNVMQNDQLIVSKKDYQDAIINVSELKPEMIIKLEKVSEVELKEAFVTNLKAEDILKKVIENYDKNFNTEQHFYKINFKRDAVVDSVNRDLIDVDLQFRFKKGNVKILSNNVVNERIIGEGSVQNRTYSMYQYFNHISLLEVTKRMLNRFIEKYYDNERVQISKYADKYMYEIEFSNQQSKVVNWFLIDKETFAIVEHKTKMENVEYKKSNDIVVYYDMIFKYRPYQGKWILKETSSTSSTLHLDEEKNQHLFDVKVNLEVKDFSTQAFPEFNKYVNEKMDIRKSFK